MIVLIIGENYADIARIKSKDEGKHFFAARGQAYKVYPDGLTRCMMTKDGKPQESEEIIVYRENCVRPHNPRTLDYSTTLIIAEIQTHKNNVSRGLLARGNIWMTRATEAWKAIAPYAGIILCGIVLAWAFLTS